MKFVFAGLSLVSFLVVTSVGHAEAPPYCMAIRGNGELAPAHWGAVSQVVERLGLPQAMAGGSSASITMFLVESIAINPSVAASFETQKSLRASFLIKSLQAYLEVILSRPEWKELAALTTYISQKVGADEQGFAKWLQKIAAANPNEIAQLLIDNATVIERSLKAARDLGLVDSKTLAPLLHSLNNFTMAQTAEQKSEALRAVNFFAGELYQSIALLGKFNAETDSNLFFRPGLIDFKELAKSIGSIGDFYTGRSQSEQLRNEVAGLIARCHTLARGVTWSELRRQSPHCDREFKALVGRYQADRAKYTNSNLLPREQDAVGQVIPSFAATSVLTGEAAMVARRAQREYYAALDANFGRNFSVANALVRFGYWGRDQDLARIAARLRQPYTDSAGRRMDLRQDVKSQRFYPLGETSWAQVMSLSPAEPGLAPLQPFTANETYLYSAGGWSDLHPVAILKAHGCEDVVYITRRGGESLFAQGVAKRLLDFSEVPWTNISTRDELKMASSIRNNNGDDKDLTSLWSQLFNLANPNSSFNRAISLADATVCTNWNAFDATSPGGVEGMIGDAYRAPWALSQQAHNLEVALSANRPPALQARDNAYSAQLGYRPFAGCIAF